jgi:hypothetical protein
MFKCFALIFGCVSLILSCDSLENNDAVKIMATKKMKEKVSKVSAELKAYCDSEMYRKARFKEDSILVERKLKRLK